MKTRKLYEMEIQRTNVTPAQFLSYVRSQAKKKGIMWTSDLTLEWFEASGMEFNYNDGTPDHRGAIAEKSVDKPYQKQTYILNFDGSMYNEIVEFDFWDEKTGNGYYYIVDTECIEGYEEENQREQLEAMAKRFDTKADRLTERADKKEAYLDKEREWLSESFISNEEYNIRSLRTEAEYNRDKANTCRTYTEKTSEEAEKEGETIMYDYKNAVMEDIHSYLRDNYTTEELFEMYEEGNLEEKLNEELWTADSVTGNGSGSYTFNTYKAEENLAHNWDEIEKVASEFGYEPIIKSGYEYGAEWWDVAIRCYYLSECLSEIVFDIESEWETA